MQEHWIKDGQGFILVYSITDPESFSDLSYILSRITRVQRSARMPIIIVGNKCDLESQRAVPTSVVEEFCAEKKYLHIECSAKADINCKEVFSKLLESIIQKMIDKGEQRKREAIKNKEQCCLS